MEMLAKSEYKIETERQSCFNLYDRCRLDGGEEEVCRYGNNGLDKCIDKI